jgi:hypothetical protein
MTVEQLTYDKLTPEQEGALWSGNTDALPWCECCCYEHYSPSCPARVWNGCRGGNELHPIEIESWVRHYQDKHGMTREQFFGDVP